MQIGRLRIYGFCCSKENAPHSIGENYNLLGVLLIVADSIIGVSIEWVKE